MARKVSSNIETDLLGMPCIRIDGVDVTYTSERGEVQAVLDFNLNVAEGEFIALLGPSGCGKSTLLRVVSDLMHPSSGVVKVRGRPASLARKKNEFGFVFQDPALLPWRTALGNTLLPLEVVDFPAERCKPRCEELLELVGLSAFKDSYPHELSGGMKQRVAIIRALAWGAPILLMDEPFSALDEMTRNKLQEDLLSVCAVERKTVLFVTHNISEAVYLADRIVIMSPRPGRIKAIQTVNLPRPRRPEMRETIEFISHLKAAREALEA